MEGVDGREVTLAMVGATTLFVNAWVGDVGWVWHEVASKLLCGGMCRVNDCGRVMRCLRACIVLGMGPLPEVRDNSDSWIPYVGDSPVVYSKTRRRAWLGWVHSWASSWVDLSH